RPPCRAGGDADPAPAQGRAHDREAQVSAVDSAALPRPSQLGLRGRAIYHGTVAADYALRTALSTVLAGAAVAGAPAMLRRRDTMELDFYADLADGHDAPAVFEPPGRVRVHSAPGRGPGVD